MNHLPFRCILMSVAVALLILGGSSNSSVAQDGPTSPASELDAAVTPTPDPNAQRAFEFFPVETGWGTFFDVTAEPGSTVDMTVLLANVGTVIQDLRTYPSNASTAQAGGLAVAEIGEAPNEVTSWLDYSEEVYTIEPGTGVERTFALTVPVGTAPGDYVTAIVGAHAEPLQVEDSANFLQILRYATPIFITVPGDATTEFAFNDVEISIEPDILLIHMSLDNIGDTNIYPEGLVELVTADGEPVAAIPVVLGPVYARDGTDLTLSVPGGVAAGSYQVNLDFVDNESGTQASTTIQDLLIATSATPVPATLGITSASAVPRPSSDDIQFASIEAVVNNVAEPVTGAQLTLIASRNGEEVERFVLSQSLSIPNGDTPISARYIPGNGWTTGEWTFEVLLETVENGTAVVTQIAPVVGTIVIP